MVMNQVLMVQYFFTAVFCFLGVYAGAVLAFISPEELDSGKNYFRALQNSLFVLAILVLLYFLNVNIFLIILLGIVLSVFLYFANEKTWVNQLMYFLLGFVFFFAAAKTTLFIIVAASVFLFGFPTGTLYVLKRKKLPKNVVLSDLLLSYGLFVVIALLANLFSIFLAGV